MHNRTVGDFQSLLTLRVATSDNTRLYLFALLILTSCMVIMHKKYVINLDKIGDKLRAIKTDGYYYEERERRKH